MKRGMFGMITLREENWEWPRIFLLKNEMAVVFNSMLKNL